MFIEKGGFETVFLHIFPFLSIKRQRLYYKEKESGGVYNIF